jgi:hypothetical protein
MLYKDESEALINPNVSSEKAMIAPGLSRGCGCTIQLAYLLQTNRGGTRITANPMPYKARLARMLDSGKR